MVTEHWQLFVLFLIAALLDGVVIIVHKLTGHTPWSLTALTIVISIGVTISIALVMILTIIELAKQNVIAARQLWTLFYMKPQRRQAQQEVIDVLDDNTPIEGS